MTKLNLAALLTVVLLVSSLILTPVASAPQSEGSSSEELTGYEIPFIEWIFAHPGETRVQKEASGITYEAVFQIDVRERQAGVTGIITAREGDVVLETVKREFLVINQSTPKSPDTYLVIIPSIGKVIRVTPVEHTKLGDPSEDVTFYVGGWGSVYAGEDSHTECWFGATFYVAGAAHLIDEGFLAMEWDGPTIWFCWLPWCWYGTTVEAWDDKDFSYVNPWAGASGSKTVPYDHTHTWLTVKATWSYFILII